MTLADKCPHCGGLLVLTDIYTDRAECQHFQLISCVNCGYATDPVMEANKRNPTAHIVGKGKMKRVGGTRKTHKRRYL